MDKDGYLEGLGRAFACDFISVWEKLDPLVADQIYEPCEDTFVLMDGFHLDHVWRTEQQKGHEELRFKTMLEVG
jgi:hypothetical protein